MSYRMPIVLTGVAVAAAAPMLLHGHPTRDCVPRIELCAWANAAYLPDEPAPEHAPALIHAPTVAVSTASASSAVVTPLKAV
jgi:hypothetical protein